MLTAPIHHHVALTAQDVLTFGSWGITFILLAVAVELGRRERTPFYVLVVLAAMVAAFAEPLYDEAFMLYFYSTHGMQSVFHRVPASRSRSGRTAGTRSSTRCRWCSSPARSGSAR